MKTRTSIVCILAAFLASCTAYTNVHLGDGGLLSDVSCGPPCFWGITPGVTREAEAWSILKKQGVSQACNTWNNSSSSGTRGIDCEFSGKGLNRSLGVVSIGLDTNSDAIMDVAFTPSDAISLHDVISKYGIPTWVAVWGEGTPEHVGIAVTVFYDAIVTRLDLPVQEGSAYSLGPDAEIYGVGYFNPKEYSAYLQQINRSLQAWKGYGTYSQK